MHNRQVSEALREEHYRVQGGSNSRVLRHINPKRLMKEQRAMAWTEQLDVVDSFATRFSVIVVESKV